MITFSTEFPLAPTAKVSDVLGIACKWLTGSPHSRIEESSFSVLPKNEAIEVRVGDELAVAADVTSNAYQMAGLQYRRVDDGLEWTTSIVIRKDQSEVLFSVLVSCESFGTAVTLPRAKKPYIIRQVLDEVGGGADGEIPVADKPFYLGEAHVHVAAALIDGAAQNKLPIVYVSSGFDGRPAIDAAELAPHVSGLAHVVVEPSRGFSAALRGLVDGRNVYGGTVGVYWPRSRARKSYYLSIFDNDPRALQRAISDDLRTALSNRRLSSGCTWAHLQEELSRFRVNLLRDQGSSSLNDYVEAFDTELRAKEQRLLEAEEEIQRLNSEIRRLSASNSSNAHGNSGVLSFGKEHDLYPSEVRNVVISVLESSLPSLRQNGRREHIVRDLIGANPVSSEPTELEREIKAALRDYRSMDAKVRAALVRMGFAVSDEGKHVKVTFRGDPRYMFVLPKTSSDHRAGKNAASDITSTLF